MEQLALALAAAALLVAFLALVGLGRLAVLVRELQQAQRESWVLGDQPHTVVEALRAHDGSPALVLAVTGECPTCQERFLEFSRWAPTARGVRPVVLALDAGAAAWGEPPGVRLLADRDLVDRLALGATPAVVVVGPDGLEEERALVATPEALSQWTRRWSTDPAEMTVDAAAAQGADR